jgi:hypothetical protein
MKKLLTILSIFGITALTYPITLTWDPNTETDLAGYTLHWGTNVGGPYPYSVDVKNVTIYNIPNTNFLFMKKYYVVATAINTSGLRSVNSSEVSFTLTNTVPPTMVKNPKIVSITP